MARKKKTAASRAMGNKSTAASTAAEKAALNPRSATGVQANQAQARDIKITGFSLSLYGTRLIDECELEFNYGRRYGLIGLNGCGKSTLLQCLGNRDVPIQDHIDIYLLDREVEASETTALAAVVGNIEERINKLEERAEVLVMSPDAESDAVSMELEGIYDLIEELDPAKATARAARLLHGLGFSHADQQKETRAFSGGWRMRIALARALFIQPSMLLLDEPTNHLDLEACVWLETYLREWKSMLVIISHSQDFMNGVCTNIIHMTQRTLRYYTGNFDAYVTTRNELDVNQLKKYKWEQQQIASMKNYIARFGHGNAKLARQAQSKEKVLAKMEAGGLTDRPESEGAITLSFTAVQDLPPPVLQFQEVGFGYPGCPLLYSGVDFGVDLDSRVALVGRNGVGKSTLLKLMTGELDPREGAVRRHAKLRLGFYQQHLTEVMDMDMTPLTYLMSRFPAVTEEQEMRTMMGRFGLSGAQQTQKIGTLSDGLRCRIAFAMLAFETPQILLLDEPTNHLDIETIDALADGINKWNGGMVLVSHDFRLINQVAHEIWVCGDMTVAPYKGTIAEYKQALQDVMLKEEEDFIKNLM